MKTRSDIKVRNKEARNLNKSVQVWKEVRSFPNNFQQFIAVALNLIVSDHTLASLLFVIEIKKTI